jgi:hypothetical protein
LLSGGGRFGVLLGSTREGTEIVVRREKEIDTEMTALFIETGVQTGDDDTERERDRHRDDCRVHRDRGTNGRHGRGEREGAVRSED